MNLRSGCCRLMKNNYSCLDLNIVKEEVAELAQIEQAQDFIRQEPVDFNPLVIKNKVAECQEALKLLNSDFYLSFDGIKSIDDLLKKADKGICLSGKELIDTLVFHNHCVRIKKIFDKLDNDLLIKDYSDSLQIDSVVFDRISSYLEIDGSVKQDATSLLKNINEEFGKCENELYNKAYIFIDKHRDSLQEPTLFFRNNRLCFLVKNSDKNKYKGFTHGNSSSGLATYVEPGSFIDYNNLRLKLLQDKQDEIERILMELTYLLSTVSIHYYHNFESVLALSVIFAKANYGYKNCGILPQLCEDNYFCIKDYCHPLIPKDKVVSNTYRLFAPYQGMVICGTNTGGKTVSLKGIGLSVIMTYLAIPIIASQASIPLYKNVYVDIDDNQSIKDSLSTFSAHISNINRILNVADKHSLILIDELISGTDPKQAQAISLAILDKIKQCGSIFVVTTHFDEIKKYAYQDPEILLSSVGFDMEELKPTYKYLEDRMGSSNALEIASRFFDDQCIIENAKKYLEINKTKQDALIDELSAKIQSFEKQKDELAKKEKELADLTYSYQQEIKNFNNSKEELKRKYLAELNEYIDTIKAQAREKLEQLNSKNADFLVEKIDNLKSSKEEEKVEVHFEVGDNVRIKDNEQIGNISKINGNKVTVLIRGMSVITDLNDLTLMPKTKKQNTTVNSKQYHRLSSQINLVGQRVEDALILTEEYLDKANAAHMSQVKIIHGYGSGALRQAIRQRLSKLSYVANYKDGDYYDGGSGVTIVEFNR